MNAEMFVGAIRKEIVQSNLTEYRELLSNAAVEQAEDETWRKVIGMYRSLNASERKVFLEFLRR